MIRIRCRLVLSAAGLVHSDYRYLVKSYEESAKGAIHGTGAVSIPTGADSIPTKPVGLAACQPITLTIAGVILTLRAAPIPGLTTQ